MESKQYQNDNDDHHLNVIRRNFLELLRETLRYDFNLNLLSLMKRDKIIDCLKQLEHLRLRIDNLWCELRDLSTIPQSSLSITPFRMLLSIIQLTTKIESIIVAMETFRDMNNNNADGGHQQLFSNNHQSNQFNESSIELRRQESPRSVDSISGAAIEIYPLLWFDDSSDDHMNVSNISLANIANTSNESLHGQNIIEINGENDVIVAGNPKQSNDGNESNVSNVTAYYSTTSEINEDNEYSSSNFSLNSIQQLSLIKNQSTSESDDNQTLNVNINAYVDSTDIETDGISINEFQNQFIDIRQSDSANFTVQTASNDNKNDNQSNKLNENEINNENCCPHENGCNSNADMNLKSMTGANGKLANNFVEKQQNQCENCDTNIDICSSNRNEMIDHADNDQQKSNANNINDDNEVMKFIKLLLNNIFINDQDENDLNESIIEFNEKFSKFNQKLLVDMILNEIFNDCIDLYLNSNQLEQNLLKHIQIYAEFIAKFVLFMNPNCREEFRTELLIRLRENYRQEINELLENHENNENETSSIVSISSFSKLFLKHEENENKTKSKQKSAHKMNQYLINLYLINELFQIKFIEIDYLFDCLNYIIERNEQINRIQSMYGQYLQCSRIFFQHIHMNFKRLSIDSKKIAKQYQMIGKNMERILKYNNRKLSSNKSSKPMIMSSPSTTSTISNTTIASSSSSSSLMVKKSMNKSINKSITPIKQPQHQQQHQQQPQVFALKLLKLFDTFNDNDSNNIMNRLQQQRQQQQHRRQTSLLYRYHSVG